MNAAKLTWVTAANTHPEFKATELLTATLTLSNGAVYVYEVVRTNGSRYRLLVNGVKDGADAEGEGREMRQTIKAEERAAALTRAAAVTVEGMNPREADAFLTAKLAELAGVENAVSCHGDDAEVMYANPVPYTDIHGDPEAQEVAAYEARADRFMEMVDTVFGDAAPETFSLADDAAARYEEVRAAYAATPAFTAGSAVPESETFPLVNPDADTGSTEVRELPEPEGDGRGIPLPASAPLLGEDGWELRRMAELNAGVVTEVIEVTPTVPTVPPTPPAVTVTVKAAPDGWTRKVKVGVATVSACGRGRVLEVRADSTKEWHAWVDGTQAVTAKNGVEVPTVFRSMKAAKEWADAEIARTAAPVTA